MATTSGITGLASGMDIDSMVTQSMSGYQTRYDSMYKKQQTAEWTKDAYNEWYTKLTDFQNNTLYKYSLSSGMMPKTASSSNTSVVTASAGSAAANLSHNITVMGMSSNAYLKSTADITRPTGVDSNSISLADIMGMTGIKLTAASGDTSATDTLTFTMNGTEYTLTGDEMDKTAVSFTLRDGTTTTDPDTNVTSKTNYTVSLSYRDLAEGTLNDLASKISNSGTNISATYDSVNDAFSIYNKKGGTDNLIDITVDAAADTPAGLDSSVTTSKLNTQNLLSALNMGAYNASTDSLGTAISTFSDTPTDVANDAYTTSALAGTAGSVKIDGRTYSTDSNQVSVDGVTYNLVATSQITGTDGSGNNVYQSSSVSVTTDIDTVIKNVKQFVSDYNDLLSSLKDDIYEEPDSNYAPLTDDEKKAMSDDEVTSWTKKAKAGLLYHDSTLTTLVDNMRSAVNQVVDGIGGSYNSLNNIGISVSADWSSDSSGVLSVDEDKLRTALSSDPEAAYKLFANPGYSSDDSSTYGIVRRLNTAMSTAIGTGSGDIATASGIRGLAGVTDSSNDSDQSYWGDQIANWTQKMSDFQDIMDKYQSQLYDQFDAMETAISNQNTQYSYISSFLGS